MAFDLTPMTLVEVVGVSERVTGLAATDFLAVGVEAVFVTVWEVFASQPRSPEL